MHDWSLLECPAYVDVKMTLQGKENVITYFHRPIPTLYTEEVRTNKS